MSGIEISSKPKLVWIGASVASAVVSLAAGIWIGPRAVYVASGVGIGFALVAWLKTRKPLLPSLLTGFHFALIVIAFTLGALFLEPLSNETLQMPHLTQTYRDPGGFFELRAPAGWETEEIHGATEAGVRLHPSDREQYMGVSELTVRVRLLETVPNESQSFLDKMARMVTSSRMGDPKLFDFSTTPAALLNGDKGLWSRLTVKRFWVPLYQLALFGIKEKRYLCSVSATGLKHHATLSEVLCLGVYETIRPVPKHS